MAAEETPNQILNKVFWVTIIGAALFIGTVFAFIL